MVNPNDKLALSILLRNLWATTHSCTWIRLIDTQSMSPVLSSEVSLFVQWTRSLSDLQLGDLVVFQIEPMNVLIVHRVCQVDSAEGQQRCLQVADAVTPDGVPSGSWLDSETVFGSVIAIRLCETDTTNIDLLHPFHRFFGKLIARTSAMRWEAYQRSQSLIVSTLLHRVATHLYGSLFPLSSWLVNSNKQSNKQKEASQHD